MGLFSCAHPFKYLAVQRDHDEKVSCPDFVHVDYHFRCMKCGAELQRSWSRLIGGVDEFLARGKE